MFVRAKVAEQTRARELRRLGWSLRAIAAELSAALSSVSVWVRDIPTPARPREIARVRKCLQLLSGTCKRCGRCRKSVPLELFNRCPQNGRQHWCRACFKAYFQARGSRHREQVSRNRVRRRERAREFVLALLRRSTCSDCPERDILVLEFDHVRGEKTSGISQLINIGASISKIQAEIAKCEIVCANCHRLRTAARRIQAPNVERRMTRSLSERTRRARIAAHVGSVLEGSTCADCKFSDPRVLEFDHVRGVKRFNISDAVKREVSIATLRAEISKCDLRCANCHRRRTAREVGSYRCALAR